MKLTLRWHPHPDLYVLKICKYSTVVECSVTSRSCHPSHLKFGATIENIELWSGGGSALSSILFLRANTFEDCEDSVVSAYLVHSNAIQATVRTRAGRTSILMVPIHPLPNCRDRSIVAEVPISKSPPNFCALRSDIKFQCIREICKRTRRSSHFGQCRLQNAKAPRSRTPTSLPRFRNLLRIL